MSAATTPMRPLPSRIGPLLMEWRQRRRLSHFDLALEADVSARHLSFIETGRSRPSAQISTITTFARATDITIAELAIESFYPTDRATREALRVFANSRSS